MARFRLREPGRFGRIVVVVFKVVVVWFAFTACGVHRAYRDYHAALTIEACGAAAVKHWHMHGRWPTSVAELTAAGLIQTEEDGAIFIVTGFGGGGAPQLLEHLVFAAPSGHETWTLADKAVLDAEGHETAPLLCLLAFRNSARVRYAEQRVNRWFLQVSRGQSVGNIEFDRWLNEVPQVPRSATQRAAPASQRGPVPSNR